MVFSSAIFLFLFLPATLLCYYIVTPRDRNTLLLLASLFFYSWGEPINILVMLISIVANWASAIFIKKYEKKENLQSICFFLAIALNLGLLFYFKYIDFVISNINNLFHTSIPQANVALPIGISFFTFQALSYIIDVKRNNIPVQKNLLHLGLYISFFPQLIAGPIVRYIDIYEQINNRKINIQKLNEGCIRFMAGFSKKVLVADQLAPYVDKIFINHGISAPSAWLGIIAYALQIYFDFSGYSDMAIGLGKMFGFDFLENFNYPYISKSVKEFWRRWHISLSQWFRDYVYIPLGGSRCEKKRILFNLFAVWSLTGFWHGASWNFIFWGLYYFVFLVLERSPFGKVLEKSPNIIQHIYTILVFLVGWVFFRETGLEEALVYIQNLFTTNESVWVDFIYIIDEKFIFCILIGILFSTPIIPFVKKKINPKIEVVFTGITYITFIVAIAFLLGVGFSPFLYFRF